MKRILFSAFAAFASAAVAQNPSAEALDIPREALPPGIDARIVVTTNAPVGAIKPMNGATGAPGSKNTYNFRDWKALSIPFARIHDMNDRIDYANPWAVDVSRVFRNFDADENDLANYRFDETDWLLQRIESAGSKVFYRLGPPNETQLSANYEVFPPKDYGKYARICATIVGRYRKTVKDWEFWNEPDRETGPGGKRNAFWGGSREEFIRLYVTVAKHLKAKYPDVRIGGPSISGDFAWAEEMLAAFKRAEAPLDFFTWHCYADDPKTIAAKCREVRALLDRTGFEKAESILASWNYVRGWDRASLDYSHKVHGGAFAAKGGAFVASVMAACQNESVDRLMIKDVYSGSEWNPLFDSVLNEPLPAYYAFYAWKHLAKIGEQVPVAVFAEKVEGLSAVAARGRDGRRGLLVVRAPRSGNDRLNVNVRLELPGAEEMAGLVCHLTDVSRSYTEVPLERDPKGRFSVILKPDSFAYIEY